MEPQNLQLSAQETNLVNKQHNTKSSTAKQGHGPERWFSATTDCAPPQRGMWRCLKTFLVVTTEEAGTGIWWAEAGDAAHHPPEHKTVPSSPTKPYLAPTVNSADTEEP